MPQPEDLTAQLKIRALDVGFDVVRVTQPHAIPEAAARFAQFLDNGFQGDMSWLETNADCRQDPGVLWPEAKSIIMLGMNYGPEADPLAILEQKSKGAISVYAQGKDYHDVVKKRLKTVARWFHHEAGADVKVFVDTAPVMEKPLAAASGLGWQGKHTNLVSRDFGSWLFLGAIFTSAELTVDDGEKDHCGSCRNCLDVCPTDAFPAPYKLDARRCISYLTIEHKGHIGLEFREALGNRIYGCDDCLAVCPWNKYAKSAREIKFQPNENVADPNLEELLVLDDAGFRERFRGSPVKRTGRDRFLRNVLIATGNSGDVGLMGNVEALLEDDAPVVRAMAVWAASKLSGDEEFRYLRERCLAQEHDGDVAQEWREGCNR